PRGGGAGAPHHGRRPVQVLSGRSDQIRRQGSPGRRRPHHHPVAVGRPGYRVPAESRLGPGDLVEEVAVNGAARIPSPRLRGEVQGVGQPRGKAHTRGASKYRACLEKKRPLMGESSWPPRRRGAAPALIPTPLKALLHFARRPAAAVLSTGAGQRGDRGGSPALFDIVKHAPPWRAATAAAARSPYSAACLRMGAAARTSASTCISNLAKLVRNISTRARAWAS